MVGGQLARRYNLPYRSSNVCASNALDMQAAYESVFSLWGAVMGGVNLMMHGAGWMEGGLHAGFEKMIVDAELLQMVAAFLDPIVVDDETMAIDAMREVGPGGHFFGAAHTQSRFRTAFHKPMISDWRNYESWQEAGSPEAPGKANHIFKELLAAYDVPTKGAEVCIVAAADTVMRRPSRELMAEVYPDVPVADSVSGNDTLLDISHAREVLGYDPQFSWRDLS